MSDKPEYFGCGPSAATIERQLNNDGAGTCRICGATKDLVCDDVAHRIAAGELHDGSPVYYALQQLVQALSMFPTVTRVTIEGVEVTGKHYRLDRWRL